MKTSMLFLVVFASLLIFTPAGLMAGSYGAEACQFKEQTKLMDHVTKHVTYPATGKVVKETCKKEMPDEFTKQERQCVEKKLSNTKTYKSADEVLADLGVK